MGEKRKKDSLKCQWRQEEAIRPSEARSKIYLQMNTTLALHEWRFCFGTVMPAGFLCRAAMPERWLRIHSLPESKRYSELDDERQEILDRQNTVADYVLGEGSRCFLIFTRFNYGNLWLPKEEFLACRQSPRQISALLDNHEPKHFLSFYDAEDGNTLEFFILEVTWRRGVFDALIMASADDLTGQLLFTNTATQTIYAPYDGGAALFLPSVTAVHAARHRFAA